MSYSENYSTSVHYSGSIRYSYPASQNGGSGTANYSGDIPINVTINVNTEPFDGSVNRFKTSIDALGGSVAAMHAAQCAAIHKTGEEVSASLINGFFGTINMELSQQIQALDSAIKAGFALIMEQGKAVTDKNNAMEGDYNRISSRYIKLFADLDDECYKRIFALDKKSFTLSEKVQKELVSESSCNAAAMNLLGIEEVSSSRILVFVSSLNRKAQEVLKTLHDYITQESRINALIDSFLFAGTLNEESDENIPLCVPVIWCESDLTGQECFIPEYFDQDNQQQGKEEITEKVKAFCSGASSAINDSPKWKPMEEAEKEALNREFNLLAESHFGNAGEDTDDRVYRTMLSLWQNAGTLSLERSV